MYYISWLEVGRTFEMGYFLGLQFIRFISVVIFRFILFMIRIVIFLVRLMRGRLRFMRSYGLKGFLVSTISCSSFRLVGDCGKREVVCSSGFMFSSIRSKLLLVIRVEIFSVQIWVFWFFLVQSRWCRCTGMGWMLQQGILTCCSR